MDAQQDGIWEPPLGEWEKSCCGHIVVTFSRFVEKTGCKWHCVLSSARILRALEGWVESHGQEISRNWPGLKTRALALLFPALLSRAVLGTW